MEAGVALELLEEGGLIGVVVGVCSVSLWVGERNGKGWEERDAQALSTQRSFFQLRLLFRPVSGPFSRRRRRLDDPSASALRGDASSGERWERGARVGAERAWRGL